MQGADVRKLLSADQLREPAEVDRLVSKFYDALVYHAASHHPEKKGCKEPDCPGFLTMQRGKDEAKCSGCDIAFCFKCESRMHWGRSCTEAQKCQDKWRHFLRSLSTGEQTGACADGVDAAAGQILLRLAQEHATAAYYTSMIEKGDLKRCPQCKIHIHKTGGCRAMNCGEGTRPNPNPSPNPSPSPSPTLNPTLTLTLTQTMGALVEETSRLVADSTYMIGKHYPN